MSPSSDPPVLGWVNLNERPLDGPTEWVEACILLPFDMAELGQVTVRRNGRPLTVSARSVGETYHMVAEWPRSGPGEYRLEVVGPDCRFEERLQIAPSKLPDSEYRQILTDLEDRLPTLVVLGIQKAGGLAQAERITVEPDTMAQEIRRLRRAIHGESDQPGLVDILPQLQRKHHQVLINTKPWRPRAAARRPVLSEIMRAVRRPGNLDATGRPMAVIDAVAEPSANTYENQLVRLLLRLVDRRLRSALRAAGRTHRQTLEALSLSFEQARSSAPFLRAVDLPVFVPRQLTMVLLRVSEYRAIRAILDDFLSHVRIVHDDQDLLAPLDGFPSLYQTWCTLTIIQWLLDTLGDAGWVVNRQSLVYDRPGCFYVQVMRNGAPVLEMTQAATGLRLDVIPELNYGRSGDLCAVSYYQRPDITIRLRSPLGDTRLLLLDPKYRLDSGGDEVGRPKKEDIDKMHAYRDAIRDRDGNRVVEAAAILYPGPTQDFGHGIAAFSARPDAVSNLQAELRFWLDSLLGV